MSTVCDHGHLRRVCEICQRDDEIEQLKAERDALKDHVHRLESLCHDMAGELTVLQATKQLTAAIDAARSEK